MDGILATVRELGALDRYQASLGLEQAAADVARGACAAGLAEVEVHRFPADGRAQWWTFDAPRAWTPLTAWLTVSRPGADPGGVLFHVDHAALPCTVATYSAPTAPGGVTAPLLRVGTDTTVGARFGGAIAVVEREAFARGTLLAELTAAGALGLITDAPWKGDADLPHPGRIELPPGSSLFGFSVVPEQLRAAAEAAERGTTAHAEIAVDTSAGMPVVSGVLPGDEAADEIWLTAHLCHPRPGANDNASGVAALLGIADVLARLRRADRRYGTRRPIRFFWGPEYLGNAAVLHTAAARGGRLPRAVLNLDMVGEDQRACRSPFVVERPPETVPDPLGPLAEHVVARVFAATADSPGTWSPSPFLGFSDHALYADPSIARPAVQFCHPADRFNHSAGDAPKHVSPVEMLRSTVAGAALVQLLAGDLPERGELAGIVEHWSAREEAAARRVAHARGDAWGRGLREHVMRRNALMRASVDGEAPSYAPDSAAPDSAAPAIAGPAVSRRWEGPLNLRAMMGVLPSGTRAALAELIAADKHHLAVLFNLAIRADGTRDRRAIVEQTSYALGRPLPADATARLFDALVESGWVTEADAPADAR